MKDEITLLGLKATELSHDRLVLESETRIVVIRGTDGNFDRLLKNIKIGERFTVKIRKATTK